MSEAIARGHFIEAADHILRGAHALGEGQGDDRTVHRFAEAMLEILAGYGADSEVNVHFDQSTAMTVVRDIPIKSMCEHHLLPFSGVAHVALVPGASKRVPGLSKYARCVEKHARRLTLQERIAEDVADELATAVEAKGVMVVVECSHGCMLARGVRAHGSSAVSSAIRGCFEDAAVRAEALSLMGR